MSFVRISRFKYQCSVDVLTDGSEQTGDGTVFLSIHRFSGHRVWADDSSQTPVVVNPSETRVVGREEEEEEEDNDGGEVVARYALSGVGDCTSRLAADQRYKLKHVKAVFCTVATAHQMVGIPSLWYALQEAGAPSLSLITPSSNLESFLQAFLPFRTNGPKIWTCEIPSTTQTWWLVYRDEYIVVHAQRLSSPHNQNSVLYFYTMIPPTNSNKNNSIRCPPFSFLVCPAGTLLNLGQNFPLLDDDETLHCSFTLVIGGLPGWKNNHDMNYYWTRPDRKGDPNLLVRARQQSINFHQKLGRYFPWNNVNSLPQQEESPEQKCPGTEHQLTTGTRLIWGQEIRKQQNFEITWSKPILQRPKPQIALKDSLEESWNPNLEQFLQPPPNPPIDADPNEIQLEDDDSSSLVHKETANLKGNNGLNLVVAQWLVLGTGCAAPSPHRGASGYVLWGESTDKAGVTSVPWAIAVEVGEGFVLQWNRYSPLTDISIILVIWISHAHWDHYGGLIPLLLAIASQHKNTAKRQCPQKVPMVLAPRKVIQILNAMWPDSQDLYFHARAHEETQGRAMVFWEDWNYQFAQPPILFWDNIRVDHSCSNSFGCVIGLRRPTATTTTTTTPTKPFVLAFSGDTRPCLRFIQACQRFEAVDFLIHEATFDEAEREMSLVKKHSTMEEALDVANQVCARRTLLTHFSQRYHFVSREMQNSKQTVAMALDGMLVPLYDVLS